MTEYTSVEYLSCALCNFVFPGAVNYRDPSREQLEMFYKHILRVHPEKYKEVTGKDAVVALAELIVEAR